MVMGPSLLARSVAGGGQLVIGGGGRLAVGGSWWLAVWWGLAVGGWWRLGWGKIASRGAQAGLKALYTCTSWYAYAAVFGSSKRSARGGGGGV